MLSIIHNVIEILICFKIEKLDNVYFGQWHIYFFHDEVYKIMIIKDKQYHMFEEKVRINKKFAYEPILVFM